MFPCRKEGDRVITGVWCLNPTHNTTLFPVCLFVHLSVDNKREGGAAGGDNNYQGEMGE